MPLNYEIIERYREVVKELGGEILMWRSLEEREIATEAEMIDYVAVTYPKNDIIVRYENKFIKFKR